MPSRTRSRLRLVLYALAVATMPGCAGPASVRLPRLAAALDPYPGGEPAAARVERAVAIIRDHYVTQPDLGALEAAGTRGVEQAFAQEAAPSADALVAAALTPMLAALDPDSAYLSPALARDLRVDRRRPFGAVGIELVRRDGTLRIVAPLDGSPAARAGLAADDAIVALDGQPTAEMSLVDAVTRLRGESGTTVALRVDRPGRATPFDVVLTREQITIYPVTARVLEPGYAYVRLGQLQEHTAADLQRTLARLGEESGPLTGLILDLRRNSGGLLAEAVRIASTFIPSGLIGVTAGRHGQRRLLARAERTWSRLPLVVLVDEQTAAGSELVAGALQVHGRAVVMGRRTAGKGTVQTVFPLGPQESLRLTTARLGTRAGHSFDGAGIEPDVVLEADADREAAVRAALQRLRSGRRATT
jgi:carboxyl-terminal processing protease